MKFMSAMVGLVALIVAGPTGSAHAEHVGGPCNGQSLPLRRIEAHIVGRESRLAPKVVVHVESDESGAVVGKLILERGTERVSVVDWCRVWAGGEEGESSHSGVLHLLGTAVARNGSQRLIRVDVMPNEGGKIRVRSRSVVADTHVDSGQDGHGWISLTGEGWLALSRLRLGDARH